MKYSIILPVRNGGEYVKQCVNSILTQKLQDFNLLVLDNCSTDGTPEWLGSLQDERIKIYPSGESLSIDKNWGRIIDVPKNDFITVIGHDDLLDSNYLEVMDRLVRSHPGASLYQSHFRYINPDGAEIRKCRPMANVQTPADVVHNFLCSKMDIMGSGFMMRSRDYNDIGGIPSYPNLLFADMELWIQLSRKGYLAVDKRACFSYRVHPGTTTSTSTNSNVLNAFDQFVNYLEKLKTNDPELSEVISRDCDELLKEYCQGITHKSLRNPYRKRQTPPVSAIIDQFREYGKRLKGDDSFEPLDSGKIRMGKFIDSNFISRSLFLLFKKVFKKPVM